MRQTRKFLTRRGFTLIELAIVLVIIGIILGAILKGQELINNAKAKRLLNDIRGLSAMQYTFFDRYGRFAGDCDNDGIIEHTTNLLGLTLGDFDDTPSNVFGCGNEDDPDVAFAEFEFAQLLPVNDNATHARHLYNSAYYFGSVAGANIGAGVPGTYNVLVIREVPCYAAKIIDTSIDGAYYDGSTTTGYIREAEGGTIGDQNWTDICPTEQTPITIVYFFDRRPD